MEALRIRDFAALAEGARLLGRRPGTTLALLAVGTLLGTVGPLLQRWTRRTDDPAFLLLGMVGMLPWELYFLPRFLARTDAETCGGPLNPEAGWQVRFEERWLRTLGSKVALNLALAIGLVAMVLPGLLVLFAFGWAPYRVLLRGESLAVAMRGSLRMMQLGWRRALGMVGAALLLALAVTVGLLAVATVLHPGTGPLPLASPLRWVLESLSVATSLWLSATFLVAFQKLEGYAEPSSVK